jgi:CRP/FNR family cyclic AMP-dependent transcriptional regulator
MSDPEPQAEIVACLKETKLFRGLGQEALRALAGLVEPVTYPEHSIVLSEGAPSDSLFVLVRGGAEVVKGVGTDRETVLAVVKENSAFGEMALVSDEPRSASIRIAKETDACWIPVAAIEQWSVVYLLDSNLMLENLGLILAERLRSTDLAFAARG